MAIETVDFRKTFSKLNGIISEPTPTNELTNQEATTSMSIGLTPIDRKKNAKLDRRIYVKK